MDKNDAAGLLPMHGVQPRTEETLDPDDWTALRTLSHRIVDDAVDYLRDVRDRPVWQNMPEDAKAFFEQPLPRSASSAESIYHELGDKLMPYPLGNIHPRFWSWYMGASNFTGALGDFLAAIQGSNLGGGNHAAALMDQQVVDWCKEMVGFPASASGTLVSGGSMANIIALTVARNAKTVNTGAIDDLMALADLAAEEDVWLHVDGCIGALIAIAPDNAYRVAGIARADSIALDPHKWLHAPFEVGCALVRDAAAHRGAFALTPEYLQPTPRGIASAPWLYEYGL